MKTAGKSEPVIFQSSNFSLLIAIFSLITAPNIFTQTDSTSLTTEEIIYDILQESREESDNENVYEIFEELVRNPIDLNTAALPDLQKIPGLTVFFASKIIKYRNKFGPFFSVNEISSVEELPRDLVEKIKPFLTVTGQDFTSELKAEETSETPWETVFSKLRLRTRNRVTNDLQERRGFTENKYEGSSPKIYNRFLFEYDNVVRAGLVTEKDAGEKSFTEFTAFHFSLKDLGIIKHLVLGDYTLEFGQGLALWSPYSLSKGTDVIYPLKRKGKIIIPYKSTNENNFFRGTAASIAYESFTISAFYSNNYFDANIDSISRNILSTPIDGFHRTESEINKKRSARERFYGMRIDFANPPKNINLGLLYYISSFSNSFFHESPFDVGGDRFNYYSFYYDVYFGQINIFGESAFDGRSVASLASVSFSINKDFSFLTLIRNYPRNYRNIHSYGFGENSGATQNEFGIYTGFQWSTLIGEINFYFDQFKFPYATFENPLPSNGNEFLFGLRSKPLSKIETNLRFKYEKKEITEMISNLEILVYRLRRSIRGEVTYSLSKKIRLKSRVEYNIYSVRKTDINEDGLIAFQDIRFSPSQNLIFDGRIIFFQTDSFNSAIYEFENDLFGLLSNVALYGKGIRWYFIVKYRLTNFLSLSAKYSETYKPLEKNLSSGLSEINNNIDNKLGVQVELIF